MTEKKAYFPCTPWESTWRLLWAGLSSPEHWLCTPAGVLLYFKTSPHSTAGRKKRQITCSWLREFYETVKGTSDYQLWEKINSVSEKKQLENTDRKKKSVLRYHKIFGKLLVSVWKLLEVTQSPTDVHMWQCVSSTCWHTCASIAHFQWIKTAQKWGSSILTSSARSIRNFHPL